MSLDLIRVKAYLRTLSPRLASDAEILEMIEHGVFNDVLQRHAPLRIRHSKAQLHSTDQRERFALRQELDSLKKERLELIRRLSEADRRVAEMAEQLTQQRRSFAVRVKRSKSDGGQLDK